MAAGPSRSRETDLKLLPYRFSNHSFVFSETEQIFQWSLRQWNEKPFFKEQIDRDGDTQGDGCSDGPRVLAEPLHEQRDENDRANIDAEIRHGEHVDRGWNHDAEDLAQLSPFGEQLTVI